MISPKQKKYSDLLTLFPVTYSLKICYKNLKNMLQLKIICVILKEWLVKLPPQELARETVQIYGLALGPL
ncbi:hypothetical protein BJP34_22655 [Moorena producens PAL-8-15-08-1]|uniref:Uncharacterized protein n=1 Tax=Moorena producens PAL-8-15-08-1 TaxID=1458985 RepID=A0A1D8TWE8_9CYAN|nr:hypothetical protein BJP34_22655 [Moorena producens PAL-8-15-08-1]